MEKWSNNCGTWQLEQPNRHKMRGEPKEQGTRRILERFLSKCPPNILYNVHKVVYNRPALLTFSHLQFAWYNFLLASAQQTGQLGWICCFSLYVLTLFVMVNKRRVMIPLQYEKTAKQWTQPSVTKGIVLYYECFGFIWRRNIYFHLFQNISNGLMDGFLFPPNVLGLFIWNLFVPSVKASNGQREVHKTLA